MDGTWNAAKTETPADNAGREEDFMQLMALKKEMMERK